MALGGLCLVVFDSGSVWLWVAVCGWWLHVAVYGCALRVAVYGCALRVAAYGCGGLHVIVCVLKQHQQPSTTSATLFTWKSLHCHSCTRQLMLNLCL